MGDINNRRGKTLVLYNKQEGACAICGLQMVLQPFNPLKKIKRCSATIDHIEHRSKGGVNHMSNLRLVHSLFNASRGDGELDHDKTEELKKAIEKILPKNTVFKRVDIPKVPMKIYKKLQRNLASRHPLD